MMMPAENDGPQPLAEESPVRPRKPLTRAAAEALKEAAERREAAAIARAEPHENNGRGGLDPVRYGDWEIKGLACDF